MFRKPRPHAPAGSILGQTPSSPIEESSHSPAAPTTGSSPPSTKKPKLSHPTPTKPPPPRSTPGKPRQALLTPYIINNSAKKTQGSHFGSSLKKKGKNSLISSFFKPVAQGKGKGQSDELFARHGEYELDVSDPEDMGDEEDEGGWARGRSLTGELQLVKRDEVTSVDVTVRSEFRLEEGVKHGVEVVEGEDVVMDVEEVESTAALLNGASNAADPVTPVRKLASGLKFDPASLSLDNSRSVLFSKRGSTPSPFKKLKNTRPRSSSSSSAEEIGFLSKDDDDLELVEERLNRHIGEFLVEKVEVKQEYSKPKTTRDQAFDDSTESLGDTPIEEPEEGRVEEIEKDSSTKIEEKLEECILELKPPRKREGSAFDDEFEDIEDFADEEIGFEEQEYTFDPSNRAEAGYEDFDGNFGFFENPIAHGNIESSPKDNVKCPICAAAIGALSEKDANNHVNHCLDGTPIPLPTPPKKPPPKPTSSFTSPFFNRVPIISPTPIPSSKPSAFTKLMSTNTEAQAWASATKAESGSGGKKPRTCPFYKILFDGAITVDAFCYGAVPGCKAYFLSHFHSDHYMGLTPKWNHGPIWCSRATGNLVKRKLGVDPKYVRELPWEEWTSFDVPGVRVRGLDANHCPGSMLFLFEKGKQRVLHCGDFRASPKHIKHPLLAPGKDGVRGQRIDVVYLDTTYLNPKYAFPSQESVIDACGTMCLRLQKEEGVEKKGAVASFKSTTTLTKKIGRILVVVGTYNIGKEKVCIGIAKALNTKIFAPPNKMKICTCLEDPELDALLTSNPHEAQVHMTPLRETGPETLQEYLNTFKPHFDRIVGFRPTGWNYRPPNSRFTESPAVSTVLHSAGWRSEYKIDEMTPMRGSTRTAKLFGVPYSEHSSFRELSMFCCGLNIGKVVPTVNIGSATSRDKMKVWFERWESEKRKNGLFRVDEGDGKGGVW